MVKNLVRVTVNLTPELVEKVERYAEKLNINRTAAVSVLLSQALDAHSGMDALRSAVELAKQEKQ